MSGIAGSAGIRWPSLVFRPIRESPQAAEPCAGFWRIDLANDSMDCLVPHGAENVGVERDASGQQFVQQYTERIDVAPRVDVYRRHLRLLRAHILRRSDE